MTTSAVEMNHLHVSLTDDHHKHAAENKNVEKEKFWLMPIVDFAKRHGADFNPQDPRHSRGLTAAEATKRLEEFGRNDFTPPPKHSEFVKYLLQFTDPFMIMLIVAGILCFISYSIDTNYPINLYCGILLEGITFLSCSYAYFQEGRADSAMDNFKNMMPRYATVIRDGVSTSIPTCDIVPGDIIHVKIGSQVPADARVVWVQDLKVEMSSMTGEPNAVSRTIDSDDQQEVHASNLLFSTAQVMEGEGYGIVYGTGDKTMIGQIAHLASTTDEIETPLQRGQYFLVLLIYYRGFNFCCTIDNCCFYFGYYFFRCWIWSYSSIY